MKFVAKLIALSTLVVSAFIHAATPPPSIGISPSRLEIAVERKTTMGSATVLNLSNNDITVKSSVVNFELDERNNFKELEPEAGSLSTAMMINPVEFTIPANGSQTVRFAIMPERLQGNGEHRAMLFFSELVDTSHAGLKLNFRLGMPIYATVGEPNPVAVFNDLVFDTATNAVNVDISSLGNAQVRPTGYYLWWPLSDYPSETRAFKRVAELARDPARQLPADTQGGRLVTKPVFAGTRRVVTGQVAPPPASGEYMLILQMDAGGQTIQKAIEYAPPDVLIVDSD